MQSCLDPCASCLLRGLQHHLKDQSPRATTLNAFDLKRTKLLDTARQHGSDYHTCCAAAAHFTVSWRISVPSATTTLWIAHHSLPGRCSKVTMVWDDTCYQAQATAAWRFNVPQLESHSEPVADYFRFVRPLSLISRPFKSRFFVWTIYINKITDLKS